VGRGDFAIPLIQAACALPGLVLVALGVGGDRGILLATAGLIALVPWTLLVALKVAAARAFQAWGRVRWALPAVVGAAYGAASTWALWTSGVREGPGAEAAAALLGRLSTVPNWLQLSLAIPAAVAVAIEEELVFRGVILGGLAARLGFAPAAAVSVLTWTAGHAGNATPIGPKLAQVALAGVGLSAVQRRWGLPSAMVAHGALNVGAALAAVWVAGPG
jgi:membrane protease YdiL (CAAX protease family)